MPSAKQGSPKYHFLSLQYDSTEPWSPGPLANTLLIRPTDQLVARNYIIVYRLFVLDKNTWNRSTVNYFDSFMRFFFDHQMHKPIKCYQKAKSWPPWPKVSFSLATNAGGRCYSFPWVAPLYRWSLPYNAECFSRRHKVPFFESLVWLDLGLNPRLPGHWRTLSLTWLMGRWLIYILPYIWICSILK